MKQLIVRVAIAAATLLAAASAGATTYWNLQGKEYAVDTLYHAKIGPGTTQTSLKLVGSSILRVFYTTTDLTDPYVDIRVTMGNDKVVGCNTLSTMARNNTKEGARYFAGVNADFFGNSAPIGHCVVNGEPYYTANNTRTHFFISKDKAPGLANVRFRGTATNPVNGETHSIGNINNSRKENQLNIYTPRLGANSATNQYGSEVGIVPVEGSLAMAGKMKARVTCNPDTRGSMKFPEGGYVLSGHGTGAAFVNNLKEGDEVDIEFNSTFVNENLWQLAAGMPIILADGKVTETETALDHLTALHPRTAVGYNADRTKLVLLVVDGRSSASAGVVSRALADIMANVGCTDAMNFDGGGSSELYSLDLGVINVPSDGNERAVTNAVFAVATSPEDNEVAEIRFLNETITLPRYGYFTPTIYAYNQYGVLLDTELKGYTLSCDESFGEIVGDGATIFCNGTGTSTLTATYNGVSATVPVVIGTAQPRMRLSNVITDSFRDYTAEVVATIEGKDMPLDNKALTWTSSDETIATVSDLGVVHGLATGTASICGTVGEFSDSFTIDVQIPQTRYISVGLDPEGWTTSSVQLSNVALSATQSGALAVDYTVKTRRSNSVSIRKYTPIASMPDSIRLAFNPGDADITKIAIYAAACGQREVASTLTPQIVPNAVNIVSVPVTEFADIEDFASYPIEFASITFSLNDAASVPHRIEILGIDGVYTNIAGGPDSVEAIAIPAIISANTVKAGDAITITADLAGVSHIYDLSGRHVSSHRGTTISTGHLTPGIYILTIPTRTRVYSTRIAIR